MDYPIETFTDEERPLLVCEGLYWVVHQAARSP
jgi:hypothetical protein